jgi:hypothetical protein
MGAKFLTYTPNIRNSLFWGLGFKLGVGEGAKLLSSNDFKMSDAPGWKPYI